MRTVRAQIKQVKFQKRIKWFTNWGFHRDEQTLDIETCDQESVASAISQVFFSLQYLHFEMYSSLLVTNTTTAICPYIALTTRNSLSQSFQK